MPTRCGQKLLNLSLFLLVAAALGDRPAAQSSSPPTVSIRRVTSLNASVWPGDFNGDGITDLAATAPFNPDGSPRRVVIALGTGDGTYGAATQLPFAGEVLAVADVDKDGRRDLIIADEPRSDGDVLLLFGNGNGTFTRTSRLNSYGYASFARVDDLDGDGINDVIIGSPPFANGAVQAYRGAADGTYPELNTLATGALPMGGFVADLNGDGRKDLVVANHDGHSLSVFLNRGGFRFTPSDIPFDRQVNDVVATDINRDGKLDLLVATSRDANDDFNYTDGDVTVLRGNGDGTFAPPVSYPTAPGAWQIVVGDFTRDGMLDVATANRSADYVEDCGTLLRGVDTVSILPGNGSGTFGAASSFALGNQSTPADNRFRNSVRSLNTSDVNGDGKTDLIVSWGAILLNNPADPNWAPTVDAGPDRATGNAQIYLNAVASDVDQDDLTYSWTASNGMSVPPVADPCVNVQVAGTYTFTVTVDDGHGHRVSDAVTVKVLAADEKEPLTFTAPAPGEIVPAGAPYTFRWTSTGHGDNEELHVWYSVDNGATATLMTECLYVKVGAHQCTWNNPNPPTEQALIWAITNDADVPASGATDVFRIRTAGGGGALPSGWSHQDIGAVGAAGRASFSDGVFTVSGSGADIWNTADELHFAYQPMTTQFEIVTRVNSVQNVNAWTKAGLMVRTSLDPSASQASIFVTPGKGIAFQRRTSNGATSVHTAGAALTAPVWLRLAGFNGRVWGYYKKNRTDRWTLVDSDVLANYTKTFVGLAVTSHADGSLATATFSEVRAGAIPNWAGMSVGCTQGFASFEGSRFNLAAGCSDIWGTADAFMYVMTGGPITGDVTITARVLDIFNTHPWGKGGVMIREASSASSGFTTTGARHAFAFVTPGNGVNLQFRATTNGQSATEGTTPGVAPGWLRLSRAGNVFTASWSTDGVTFTSLGSITVTMGSSVLVGMAYTSHNTSDIGTANFEDVVISQP
jgi:regulation of enolase protein 1 (concanavalin A-like superfamily)